MTEPGGNPSEPGSNPSDPYDELLLEDQLYVPISDRLWKNIMIRERRPEGGMP